MAALPGSTLIVGGAQLCALDADGKSGGVGITGRPCRDVARTPLAKLPLSAAIHDIQVVTGPGTFDLTVNKARISAGQETLIAVAGATSVLREMRDQMAIRDSTGKHVLRAELAKRRLLGQPLLGIVAALLAIAALLRGVAPALSFASRAAAASSAVALTTIGAATEFAGGAFILARTDFLLVQLPRTAVLTSVLAALAAALIAARAAHEMDWRHSVASIAAADAALIVATLASGAHAAGVVLVVTHSLGLAALTLATAATAGARTDLGQLGGAVVWARRHALAGVGSAMVISGAPIPLLGAFWGRDALAQAALGSDALPGAGWILLVLGLLASSVLSFAVWRTCLLVFFGSGPKAPEAGPPALGRTSFALSMAAICLGALAINSVSVADLMPAGLEAWLSPAGREPSGTPIERSVRLGVLAIGWIAALAGYLAARSRYGSSRGKDWSDHEAGRLLGGLFGRTPRDVIGPLVSRPLSVLTHKLDRFDAAFDGLLALPTFAPPAEPEPALEREPAESEAPQKPPPAADHAAVDRAEPAPSEKPRRKKSKKGRRK